MVGLGDVKRGDLESGGEGVGEVHAPELVEATVAAAGLVLVDGDEVTDVNLAKVAEAVVGGVEGDAVGGRREVGGRRARGREP